MAQPTTRTRRASRAATTADSPKLRSTAGTVVPLRLSPLPGSDEYAGKVYKWERHDPKGTEVLTRHLEKLADPRLLAKHWNFAAADGKYHWREAFITLLQNLYE